VVPFHASAADRLPPPDGPTAVQAVCDVQDTLVGAIDPGMGITGLSIVQAMPFQFSASIV
jgi:hypothetical protein